MTATARTVAGVPVGMFTRPSKVLRAWHWEALRPGGRLHLMPPQPGSVAFTACWRPLQGDPSPQLALSLAEERGKRHCIACVVANGGVVE